MELSRQSLIMGNDQGRLLYLLYDVGHGKGLAGSGNAHQSLMLLTCQHTVYKLVYGLWLVAHGFVI